MTLEPLPDFDNPPRISTCPALLSDTPANIFTPPPIEPLSPDPIRTAPDVAKSEFPLSIRMPPDLSIDLPVLTFMIPLLAPDAVKIDVDPEIVGLSPLVIFTAPPTLPVEAPALILTIPPAATDESPACILISDPDSADDLPPINWISPVAVPASPTLRIIEPVEPKVFSPEVILI